MDRTADFFVAANDGVKFTRARDFGQVACKFLERVVTVFGASGVSRAATPQVVDCGVKALGGNGCCCQRLACGGGLGERKRKQQAFDGDIAVASLLRDLFGGIEHAHCVIVEAGRLLCAAAGHRGYLCQCLVGLAQGRCRIPASGLDKARRHPLFVLQQSFQEMLRPNSLMAHANGDGLRALQKTLGAVREFFEVHALFPKMPTEPLSQRLHVHTECSAAFSQHKYGHKCLVARLRAEVFPFAKTWLCGLRDNRADR